MRTPSEILADIDDIDDGTKDPESLNPRVRDLMWEVIEDVRSSYALAMTQLVDPLTEAQRYVIEHIVEDYLVNNWGDD